MDQYLMGIDLGTTALKIAVFDKSGKMLGSATLEYKLYTPQSYFVESDPGIYMDAIEKGMKILAGKGIDLKKVVAVGFSNQSETMFFVDKDGKPLRNSISWMDNRAVEQSERLTAKYGDELCYKHTGQISWGANWPVTKALWVKENEPASRGGPATTRYEAVFLPLKHGGCLLHIFLFSTYKLHKNTTV